MTPPPIWLMRQAGRYLPEYRAARNKAGSFLDLCFDPILAAEVTLQPVWRYGFDAAILFSDILVVPYGLGQGLRFVEGEGPELDAIRHAADLAKLDLDRLKARLAPVYETVKRVHDCLGPETALIGFAGAPWTVATYMVEGASSRDFTRVKAWAAARPEEFGRLIDLLVEATANHLIGQIEAGAEAVQLFDSWAGVLSEADFDRWCVIPTTNVVERVRRIHPNVPIIGFPRGAGLGYVRYARESRVQAVGLDQSVPLDWAATELQPRGAVQGNLDPVLLMVGGSAMKQAAERIMASWRAGPFVFNLGHGVLQDTPVEHVAALVDIVRGRRG